MGSCFSARQEDPAEDEKQSAAIDRQLEEDARKLKKECKILLLGSGESGKTTIVKQMKIIHQSGYSAAERMMLRTTIYKNTLDGAKAICEGFEKLQIMPTDEVTLVSFRDDHVLSSFLANTLFLGRNVQDIPLSLRWRARRRI